MQADEAAVRNALALFGSTSPSYLILQSLDAANELLADYPEKLQALLPQLEQVFRIRRQAVALECAFTGG